MSKTKKIIGTLGLVGAVAPTLVTLSCKKSENKTQVTDTTIKVKVWRICVNRIRFWNK